MWVYLIVAGLFVIGAIGTVVGGGIFTIALIPIALIVLAASVVFGGGGRAAQQGAGGEVEESHSPGDRPLPHSTQRPSGRAPTSPEALADARRTQQ